MKSTPEVHIVGAVRTAIGDFGGTLKDLTPAELGTKVIAEAVRRASLPPEDVEHVVMGNVIPSRPADAYLARVCALRAEIPFTAPALTLNRLCGSGLQAVVSAAQMMQLGEASITVAGGAESMSNAPYVSRSMRWGVKMGETAMLDALTETLTDPVFGIHMGVTAENLAERHSITRQSQDELAIESHRRAAYATAQGRFAEQILPIEIKSRKGVQVFAADEHIRSEVDQEALGKLRPAFSKSGTVTAGNASGLNDGAAAVVLATGEEVARRGLKSLAQIVSWGHAGVEPEYMGSGPIHAVPIALDRAGISLSEIDVVESNEAFAAQACAVSKVLGFDPEKLNPNGSGIALGHPIGATGAIMLVKIIYELERIGGKYGLLTMCIGGGQGIAVVVKRTQNS